jgi:hypothetical protein
MHQSLVSVIIKRLRIAVAVASEQADKQQKECGGSREKLAPNYGPRPASPTLLTNEHSIFAFCYGCGRIPNVVCAAAW